ncbi:small-subunit processome [Hesseltinella vesiculosa]|uniref:Small-subunit processome n=1 Tax=Hesseltinella vesiculosa TaxID=101127 RepID=A0A1X2GKJ9_9FUNG|nr:small-subunit processome [Hesseltinella vesiculosa]
MARSQQKKRGSGNGTSRGRGSRHAKKDVTDVFEADDDQRQIQRRGHTLDEVDNFEYEAGDIDEDDDEEIDSDDAFEDEDNDRFDHFKFAGSTKPELKKAKKQVKFQEEEPEIDLNEDDDDNAADENSEDGDDYMDLADMLDNSDDQDEDTAAVDQFLGDDGSEEQQSDSDAESDMEAFKGIGSDDSDDNDEAQESMISLIQSLSKKRKQTGDQGGNKKRHLTERNEVYEENEFNLPTTRISASTEQPKRTLDLADMMGSLQGEASLGQVKSSLESLAAKSKATLSAPLAKRVQDRLEREVAYGQAAKEITRWEPTVLENRSADHLHFPMQNGQETRDSKTSASLASTFVASTNLEKQIEQALQDAGMKDEELEAFESLKLNKLSVEEVEQRRQELAMMRELMYRHERKAKRMKKIKSKAYRKLKRKEKARLDEITEMNNVDHEMDQEDMMEAARHRAEERMTLKHKNTGKWAKRALARGQLDEGTREAIMEQLQRGEDLRRKIQGNDGDSDGSDSNDSDDDYDDAHAMAAKLDSLAHDIQQDTQPKKGLLSMKFMQDAEARNQKETMAELDSFREEWLNDEDDDQAEQDPANHRQVQNNPGRIAFGANMKNDKKPVQGTTTPSADVKLNAHGQIEKIARGAAHTTRTTGSVQVASKAAKPSPLADLDDDASNPWLQNDTSRLSKKASKSNKATSTQGKPRKTKGAADEDDDVELDLTQVLTVHKASKSPAAATKKSTKASSKPMPTAASDNDDDSDDADPTPMVPTTNKLTFSQRDLVAQAFADDNVVEEFEEEKQAVIAEDGDKVEDLTLPGWGNWGGKGVKKSAKKKKFLKVTKGISADKRKDAKLANVILNEKRHKKAEKYQSTSIPFPFKSMEQYEHSLRAPVGKEWNTTDIHRKMTKPRVITKLGTVIDPLSAPFK